MDLVKLIMDQVFGESLGKLSSLAGTDTETARSATEAAVPAILSGLSNLAANDDGARKLASTLNGLESSGLGNLSSLTKLLGGDTGSLLQKGGSMLSSLFGDNLVSGIAGAIGRFAGLDTAAAKKLLAPLLPMILGVIAGQWKSRGGSVGALTNLFADQSKNISAALPSGFSLASIPGLQSADGALRAASHTARATGETARRTAAAAHDTGSSVLKWLLPLAALVLVALGLWYYFGRTPDEPAVAGNTTQASVNRQTVLKPALPDVPDVAAVTKDLTGVFTSATKALGGIKNAASAEAALPELKQLGGKIDGIRDLLDTLPKAGQAALGEQIGKQFGPLQKQAAKILEMPGVSDQVKSTLTGITSKLAGLNLAQVSKDATSIFTTLTKTLNGFTDAASAEEAVPQLEEVSGKLDELKRIQTSMSPGGKSMLAKLIAAARGPLDKLIASVLEKLGADAVAVKPILDGIVNKLTGLAPPDQA